MNLLKSLSSLVCAPNSLDHHFINCVSLALLSLIFAPALPGFFLSSGHQSGFLSWFFLAVIPNWFFWRRFWGVKGDTLKTLRKARDSLRGNMRMSIAILISFNFKGFLSSLKPVPGPFGHLYCQRSLEECPPPLWHPIPSARFICFLILITSWNSVVYLFIVLAKNTSITIATAGNGKHFQDTGNLMTRRCWAWQFA